MNALKEMIYSAPSPKAIQYTHFPTVYQAVIFRNWEMIQPSKLAEILETDEETILRAAEDMGLRVPPLVDERWLKYGYITILRNNWHLLPIEQLLKLLDWDEEQLYFALKEDDFLWIKLGRLKPKIDPVKYRPLNEKEQKQTEKIRETIVKYFRSETTWKPFGFLDELSQPVQFERIKYGAPNSGEVALDSDWYIKYDKNSAFLDGVVERFKRHIFQAYGVMLQSCGIQAYEVKFEGVSKPIHLIVEPNSEKLSESHEIEISSDSIIIKAVDEIGIMRGLQWLEDTFEKRRAPYLYPGKVVRNTKFDLRMLYPYSSLYGDPFTDSEIDPIPEGLLERLAMTGINGIWFQSVLYKMVPFPFDPSISAGWEQRIKGLNRLIEKASKYGIGIYLYMNEPRAMPAEFFKKYPELAGSVHEDYTCMCTGKKEVRDYLRNACERLFKEAPGLAGVFTITMSENLTNCYSRGVNNCPVCSKRKPYEVIGEVNRCIEEGVHKASPKAKVICWNWAWEEQNGWKNEDIGKAVECLPSNIRLMCTSESEMEYTIAGVSSKVSDYTISLPGPGARAKLFWQEARKRNIPTMAKVQLNNTWECSAVPYIPVMDLIKEHLDNLSREGVTGLMVSWTLGGYPSVNLKFASKYFWKETVNVSSANTISDTISSGVKDEGTSIDSSNDTATSEDPLSQAYTAFSNAFREFPFHVGVAYYGPQNFGPMNLLLPEKSGYHSTMIGFPYDDLEHWRSIYPEEVFIEQFKKLSDKWNEGIKLLEKVPDCPQKDELIPVAKALHCHFRSTYLQSLYVRYRDNLPPKDDYKVYNKRISEIRDIIRQEQKLALELWEIIGKDSRIGFEASNHYFYTEKSLKEKVINCRYLLDKVFVPIVTQADIEAALRQLGITEGDIVLVHSSLSSLGYVVKGAQTVIDAFEAVIGKEGTLVFPTLCQKDFERSYETWHLDKPSDVGYLTEYFRKLPGVIRSDQATHSVAARGKYAYELTFEHSVQRGLRYGIFGDTPFSEASPWQKLYDMGAKVVFLGVTMQKNTMKHFMEYRVVNETLEKIKDEEARKRLKDRIWHFKDYRNRGNKIWPFHNGEQLQQALDKAGMIRKATCGKAELICVNIKEMVDMGMKWFEEDPETWYTPDVIEWLKEAKAAMEK